MYGISKYFHLKISIKWENKPWNPLVQVQDIGWIALVQILTKLFLDFHQLAPLNTERILTCIFSQVPRLKKTFTYHMFSTSVWTLLFDLAYLNQYILYCLFHFQKHRYYFVEDCWDFQDKKSILYIWWERNLGQTFVPICNLCSES